jgi:HEAT repeat protein
LTIQPGEPDPSPYIERLAARDPWHREAAAWSLGNIGATRASRPLAGTLLREVRSVEESGYLDHAAVVRAVVEAIRRIGATDALYALMRSLSVLAQSKGVDRETIEDIVQAIADLGGPNAMREAADRVTRSARECCPECPGLETVASVLLERLGLFGDAAHKILTRIANGGPTNLRPFAARALSRY